MKELKTTSEEAAFGGSCSSPDSRLKVHNLETAASHRESMELRCCCRLLWFHRHESRNMEALVGRQMGELQGMGWVGFVGYPIAAMIGRNFMVPRVFKFDDPTVIVRWLHLAARNMNLA